MLTRAPLLAACVLGFASSVAFGQQPAPPNDAVKALVGAWELSNADHDKVCAVTFKMDPSGRGYALTFERKCATLFPPTRDVVSWSLGKRDTLVLNDARGEPVLELLEVETGTYEGLRPNEGRYVLQNAAVAAAAAGRDQTADQMFGDWGLVRGSGRPICVITFANTAADADSFVLQVRPGCDQLVTRFGPSSWKLDRGQLVLASPKGETWRFEDNDGSWRRLPESRPAFTLVRQ